MFRHRPRWDGHGGRALSDPELEFGFFDGRMGIRNRIAVLGNGLFSEGARLAVEFAFDDLGVHRLEARASVRNGRGNGALQKIGAVQECVLRKSFLRNGEYLDQALWTILDEEWRHSLARSTGVHTSARVSERAH